MMSRRDFLIVLVLACGVFVFLTVNIATIGLTWDEPTYIDQGRIYINAVFGGEPVVPGLHDPWEVGTEHPPLAKFFIGLTVNVFGHLFGFLTSARLATVLLTAVLVVCMFLFIKKLFGTPAALYSSIFLMLIPRVFAHSMLATLDMPMAAMWVLTAIAFYKGIDSKKWSIVAGIIFGLALLVKLNAILIPFALWSWGIIFFRKKALSPILAQLIIGPLMLVALWPWLWGDTFHRLFNYLTATLPTGERTIVPTYYFGHAYVDKLPPFHYSLVMMLITIPVIVLAAGVLGIIFKSKEEKQKKVKIFILYNAGFILLVSSLPHVPKYDGVRLFLALFPFLAMLAGVGLARLVEIVKPRFTKNPRVLPLLVTLFFILISTGIFLTSPAWLGYYNLLVGGPAGANALEMEPTYWHEGTNWRVFEFLRQPKFAQAKIAFYPTAENTIDYYRMLYFADKPDVELLSVDVKEEKVSYKKSVKYAGRVQWVKTDDTPDILVLNNRKGMLTSAGALTAKVQGIEPAYVVRIGMIKKLVSIVTARTVAIDYSSPVCWVYILNPQLR